VRITARLIQASKNKHLLAATCEVERRDIFSVQGKVSGSIGRQVRLSRQIPDEQTQRQVNVHRLNVCRPTEYYGRCGGHNQWGAKGFYVAINR
jgi:hypothetical protein